MNIKEFYANLKKYYYDGLINIDELMEYFFEYLGGK